MTGPKRMRKSLAAAASAVALTTMLGAGSASAAPASSDVGVLGGTPNCVSSWVDVGTVTQTAYVWNYSCSTTKYVRVVWAFGTDSVCIELRPGQQASNTVPRYPRRFEGHKPC
ncbi:hypothetical protein [Saccharomonospora xinjiangensis]|uniref:hypothetical protein n=1 Tax=Saccharomonospora xinjiangensis TaxID=75294 RepID=UPI0012F76F67|nr:hypothetical protein [Saccharomonospora xinjiangensis]